MGLAEMIATQFKKTNFINLSHVRQSELGEITEERR